MTSYHLSQEHNLQTLLWAIGGAVYHAAVGIHTAYRAIVALMPAVLYALAILAKVLGLVAIIACTMTAVALIPLTFWAGLAITGAFAYVTFPRSKGQVR